MNTDEAEALPKHPTPDHANQNKQRNPHSTVSTVMNKLRIGLVAMLAAACVACACPAENLEAFEPHTSTTKLLDYAEKTARGSRLTPVRRAGTLSGYAPTGEDLDLVEQLAEQHDLQHAVGERYLSPNNRRATELVEAGSQFFLLVIHALMLQSSRINTISTRPIEELWERAVVRASRGWRYGSLDRSLSAISHRMTR